MTHMITQSQIKQHTAKTTTLVIERPQDYTLLDQHFRLVRYVIPDKLRYRKNPTDFGRVHNTIRDQIDYPYRSFQYDELDGKKNRKWVVYVLYPQGASITDLILGWLEDTPLPRREVSFRDLPLHVLLKLLQIRFFRGGGTSRFVGQDKCYVYARGGGGDFHYCVEVELKGAPTNTENAPTEEFRIIPHARRFGTIDPPFQPSRSLFAKRAVGDKFYFIHLKSGMEALETSVYDIVTIQGKRAKVKYHDPHDLNAGRGKIVFDFSEQFLASLRELGIVGHMRERTFVLTSLPKEAKLPISRLEVVGVYDNRLKRVHDLDDYVDLFNGMYPTLHFVAVEDIQNAPKGGTLVLLDTKAEDFEEDGILFGETDPYRVLYQDHPEVPKQSINVNPNDPNALEGGIYLDYPLIQPQDEDAERKLEVALNELYLKDAVLRGLESFPLPLITDDLAFIRRARFDGEVFTIALWFEKDRLHFANLGDPTQSGEFYQMLDKWDVDWDENYEKLLVERQRIADDGSSKDLPAFDLIVGRDLFVAIEDLEERVLYDYTEISRRQQELKTAYPIEQLRLAPYYDEIKRSTMLPLSKLRLLESVPESAPAAMKQSLTFYKRLLAYDALLGEIAITHPTLSYQELTSGEWLERIARIFGSKATGEGKYHRRVIADLYKKRGMFLSERGQEIRLYQGIWHDNTNAFVVGSPTSMNKQGQERAHLIRRFQIMQGSAHFDKEQLLSTMGVFFVRHKQYTVSPYYFHLIDLYAENVLRYLAPQSR